MKFLEGRTAGPQAEFLFQPLVGSQDLAFSAKLEKRVIEYLRLKLHTVFRLDALAKALSVIATATWLGGWLAGWLGVRHTPVLYQNG